jgi:Zn-dependent protease
VFTSFRLGRLAGFEIRVNASFLLMLVVALVIAGGATGVAIAMLAFGSVLLHELGHAIVARHLDVRVDGIELHFFGGAAQLAQSPKNPRDEIAIAAAGPAVSFALGGVSLLAASLTGVYLFALLGWINLVIGGFNLLPALPMDGGRILRAALARRMSFARATELAVKVARWVAGGLAVVGVLNGSLYQVVLAGLIWFMGSRELLLARFGAGGYRDDVEVLPRGYRYRPRDPFRGW